MCEGDVIFCSHESCLKQTAPPTPNYKVALCYKTCLFQWKITTLLLLLEVVSEHSSQNMPNPCMCCRRQKQGPGRKPEGKAGGREEKSQACVDRLVV